MNLHQNGDRTARSDLKRACEEEVWRRGNAPNDGRSGFLAEDGSPDDGTAESVRAIVNQVDDYRAERNCVACSCSVTVVLRISFVSRRQVYTAVDRTRC